MSDAHYGVSVCPTCGIPESNKWFRKVVTYDIFVCSRCYRANQKGWSLEAERVLIPRLKQLGRAIPERTENGWLPFEVLTVVEIRDA